MTDPRGAAIHFEAVKVSMRQDGKGTYITLAIHPNEVPLDLLAAPSGCRFVVAMVQTNDHGEPVKGQDADDGDRAVQSAGMLCRNPLFQKWMEDQGHAFIADEHNATEGLKSFCKIESRSELKTNRSARELFLKLREEFNASR